jgi:hypothetical protein
MRESSKLSLSQLSSRPSSHALLTNALAADKARRNRERAEAADVYNVNKYFRPGDEQKQVVSLQSLLPMDVRGKPKHHHMGERASVALGALLDNPTILRGLLHDDTGSSTSSLHSSPSTFALQKGERFGLLTERLPRRPKRIPPSTAIDASGDRAKGNSIANLHALAAESHRATVSPLVRLPMLATPTAPTPAAKLSMAPLRVFVASATEEQRRIDEEHARNVALRLPHRTARLVDPLIPLAGGGLSQKEKGRERTLAPSHSTASTLYSSASSIVSGSRSLLHASQKHIHQQSSQYLLCTNNSSSHSLPSVAALPSAGGSMALQLFRLQHAEIINDIPTNRQKWRKRHQHQRRGQQPQSGVHLRSEHERNASENSLPQMGALDEMTAQIESLQLHRHNRYAPGSNTASLELLSLPTAEFKEESNHTSDSPRSSDQLNLSPRSHTHLQQQQSRFNVSNGSNRGANSARSPRRGSEDEHEAASVQFHSSPVGSYANASEDALEAAELAVEAEAQRRAYARRQRALDTKQARITDGRSSPNSDSDATSSSGGEVEDEDGEEGDLVEYHRALSSAGDSGDGDWNQEGATSNANRRKVEKEALARERLRQMGLRDSTQKLHHALRQKGVMYDSTGSIVSSPESSTNSVSIHGQKPSNNSGALERSSVSGAALPSAPSKMVHQGHDYSLVGGGVPRKTMRASVRNAMAAAASAVSITRHMSKKALARKAAAVQQQHHGLNSASGSAAGTGFDSSASLRSLPSHVNVQVYDPSVVACDDDTDSVISNRIHPRPAPILRIASHRSLIKVLARKGAAASEHAETWAGAIAARGGMLSRDDNRLLRDIHASTMTTELADANLAARNAADARTFRRDVRATLDHAVKQTWLQRRDIAESAAEDVASIRKSENAFAETLATAREENQHIIDEEHEEHRSEWNRMEEEAMAEHAALVRQAHEQHSAVTAANEAAIAAEEAADLAADESERRNFHAREMAERRRRAADVAERRAADIERIRLLKESQRIAALEAERLRLAELARQEELARIANWNQKRQTARRGILCLRIIRCTGLPTLIGGGPSHSRNEYRFGVQLRFNAANLPSTHPLYTPFFTTNARWGQLGALFNNEWKFEVNNAALQKLCVVLEEIPTVEIDRPRHRELAAVNAANAAASSAGKIVSSSVLLQTTVPGSKMVLLEELKQKRAAAVKAANAASAALEAKNNEKPSGATKADSTNSGISTVSEKKSDSTSVTSPPPESSVVAQSLGLPPQYRATKYAGHLVVPVAAIRAQEGGILHAQFELDGARNFPSAKLELEFRLRPIFVQTKGGGGQQVLETMEHIEAELDREWDPYESKWKHAWKGKETEDEYSSDQDSAEEHTYHSSEDPCDSEEQRKKLDAATAVSHARRSSTGSVTGVTTTAPTEPVVVARMALPRRRRRKPDVATTDGVTGDIERSSVGSTPLTATSAVNSLPMTITVNAASQPSASLIIENDRRSTNSETRTASDITAKRHSGGFIEISAESSSRSVSATIATNIPTTSSTTSIPTQSISNSTNTANNNNLIDLLPPELRQQLLGVLQTNPSSVSSDPKRKSSGLIEIATTGGHIDNSAISTPPHSTDAAHSVDTPASLTVFLDQYMNANRQEDKKQSMHVSVSPPAEPIADTIASPSNVISTNLITVDKLVRTPLSIMTDAVIPSTGNNGSENASPASAKRKLDSPAVASLPVWSSRTNSLMLPGSDQPVLFTWNPTETEDEFQQPDSPSSHASASPSHRSVTHRTSRTFGTIGAVTTSPSGNDSPRARLAIPNSFSSAHSQQPVYSRPRSGQNNPSGRGIGNSSRTNVISKRKSFKPDTDEER